MSRGLVSSLTYKEAAVCIAINRGEMSIPALGNVLKKEVKSLHLPESASLKPKDLSGVDRGGEYLVIDECRKEREG